MSFSRLAAGGLLDPFCERHCARWVRALIALGIAARVFRWAVCFPLWCDEAYLSANFLQRAYGDMFRPLEYHQVCPLGFLWAQLSAVRLLGFSEWSLRLVPLLAGVAALLVFARLARRLLSGAALALAVAMFACSYPAIRYSAEAKPYGVDLLASVVLLWLAVEWLRRPRRRAWLWALVAVVPVALFLSFPAVFVVAAISLAGLADMLVRRGGRSAFWPWLAFNLAVAAGLLAMWVLCIRPQASAELAEIMQPYWSAAFPPLGEPLRLAAWLFQTHTGEIFSHPVGGPDGASTATALACLLGVAALCRRRRLTLLVLTLSPWVFNFAVAAAHRYPYGGHVRMGLYLAPLVCLLAGFGAALFVAWLARGRPHPGYGLPILLVAMALVPVGSMVRDTFSPGKTAADARARDFARWFWVEQSRDAELVCMELDWRINLAPGSDEVFYSALYLCNARICSPRLERGEPPQLDRVSAERPLRCVQYHSQRFPLDEKALAAWLAQMSRRWRLVDRRQYRVTHAAKDGEVIDVSLVETWEFVPLARSARSPARDSPEAPACAHASYLDHRPKSLPKLDFLLAAAASACSASSPQRAAARPRTDCVIAALGACSNSGTPLLRTSTIVR